MPTDDSVVGEGVQPIVKYIEWGLADFVDDTIYLNKKLKRKRWTQLHDELLAHEIKHLKGEHLLTDLKPTSRTVNVDGLLFMLNNPKSLAQFSPFRFYPDKRKLYIDRQLLIRYMAMFFTVVIVWLLF